MVVVQSLTSSGGGLSELFGVVAGAVVALFSSTNHPHRAFQRSTAFEEIHQRDGYHVSRLSSFLATTRRSFHSDDATTPRAGHHLSDMSNASAHSSQSRRAQVAHACENCRGSKVKVSMFFSPLHYPSHLSSLPLPTSPTPCPDPLANLD